MLFFVSFIGVNKSFRPRCQQLLIFSAKCVCRVDAFVYFIFSFRHTKIDDTWDSGVGIKAVDIPAFVSDRYNTSIDSIDGVLILEKYVFAFFSNKQNCVVNRNFPTFLISFLVYTCTYVHIFLHQQVNYKL